MRIFLHSHKASKFLLIPSYVWTSIIWKQIPNLKRVEPHGFLPYKRKSWIHARSSPSLQVNGPQRHWGISGYQHTTWIPGGMQMKKLSSSASTKTKTQREAGSSLGVRDQLTRSWVVNGSRREDKWGFWRQKRKLKLAFGRIVRKWRLQSTSRKDQVTEGISWVGK